MCETETKTILMHIWNQLQSKEQLNNTGSKLATMLHEVA
jgi:hypothetical protein